MNRDQLIEALWGFVPSTRTNIADTIMIMHYIRDLKEHRRGACASATLFVRRLRRQARINRVDSL